MKPLIILVLLFQTVFLHTAHLHEKDLDAVALEGDNTNLTEGVSAIDLKKLPLSAKCEISSHSIKYDIKGYIQFLQTKMGDKGETETEIFGRIEGVTPDTKHSFHIYEQGDFSHDDNGCETLAKSHISHILDITSNQWGA